VADIAATVTLSAAIAKTGVRNRAEAVREADERGWL
jgi:DNA-binding CsgD family transcriptional regulator